MAPALGTLRTHSQIDAALDQLERARSSGVAIVCPKCHLELSTEPGSFNYCGLTAADCWLNEPGAASAFAAKRDELACKWLEDIWPI